MSEIRNELFTRFKHGSGRDDDFIEAYVSELSDEVEINVLCDKDHVAFIVMTRAQAKAFLADTLRNISRVEAGEQNASKAKRTFPPKDAREWFFANKDQAKYQYDYVYDGMTGKPDPLNCDRDWEYANLMAKDCADELTPGQKPSQELIAWMAERLMGIQERCTG